MPTPKPTSPAPHRPFRPLSLQLTRLGAAMVVVGVVLLGVVVVRSNSAAPVAQATSTQATVEVTAQGFQPATLAVAQGTQVVWVTDGTPELHIVASDPYPSDTSLPGLKSSQLGSNTTYHYTFTKAGTYRYHDDLNPSLNGVVTVR